MKFNSIGSHITTYCILFNRLCCAGLKLAAAADAAVVVGWTFNIWGLFAYGISELTTWFWMMSDAFCAAAAATTEKEETKNYD